MSDHSHGHHHHHHPGHAHPPAVIGASILRLSLLERMATAVAVSALIWALTLWAMQ